MRGLRVHSDFSYHLYFLLKERPPFRRGLLTEVAPFPKNVLKQTEERPFWRSEV